LRIGMQQRATGIPYQRMLFDDVAPAWVVSCSPKFDPV